MEESGLDQVAEIKDVVRTCLEHSVPAHTMQSLDDTSPLITGGILDSITLVELVASLEDHYGVTFHSHEMGVDYFNTVTDIASTVQTKLAGKS